MPESGEAFSHSHRPFAPQPSGPSISRKFGLPSRSPEFIVAATAATNTYSIDANTLTSIVAQGA